METLLIFSQLILLLTMMAAAAAVSAENTTAAVSYENIINRYHLKLIEGSMDLTSDPCENFYQYACGNWDNMHTDNSKYHDYYRMVDYYTNKEMAVLLANESLASTKEPRFVQNVAAYYRSCVGLKNFRFREYLSWLEKNEHINMMLMEPRNSSNLDWLKHWAIMNKYGLSGIFVEETYYKSAGILKLTRPIRNAGFKRLSLENFDILSRLAFMTKNDQLRMQWADFSAFEESLLKLGLSANGTSGLFRMHNLPDLPGLNRYVNMLLENTRFNATNLRVLIKDMSYLEQLETFLEQYSEEFLCEYLKIRFLWHLIGNVRAKLTPEVCALTARNFMYLATDFLFERQHVDLVKSKPKIMSMYANIKDHYKKVLLTNPNGFNATVLKFLLDKLNSTELVVGLLPRLNTQQTLETMYSSLQLNESDLYGNQLQLLKFNHNHTLLTLIPTRNRSEYVEHKKKLSPYFHRLFNIIVLPITTLQLPIYDVRSEDYYKYSSLGYILGHELTHGFDTMGTKRDRNGLVIDIYHDMINSNPKFQQNLACLRRLNNGQINEKIADVTGFRVAFQTYFERNPKARLMSLNVNGKRMGLDKLFFLNHAQFRCSTAKETMFQDESHGTAEDRIVDALAHFPEFVKTFECSKYADMHLETTCQLWRK